MNKDLKLVKSELEKYGLGIDVSLTIHEMPNDRGRMVPHMVAKWSETTMTQDGYDKLITDKVEEMNRYFDAEVFVNGITQRAAWIKADHNDRVKYLKSEPFGHPALFSVWMESRKPKYKINYTGPKIEIMITSM